MLFINSLPLMLDRLEGGGHCSSSARSVVSTNGQKNKLISMDTPYWKTRMPHWTCIAGTGWDFSRVKTTGLKVGHPTTVSDANHYLISPSKLSSQVKKKFYHILGASDNFEACFAALKAKTHYPFCRCFRFWYSPTQLFRFKKIKNTTGPREKEY